MPAHLDPPVHSQLLLLSQRPDFTPNLAPAPQFIAVIPASAH